MLWIYLFLYKVLHWVPRVLMFKWVNISIVLNLMACCLRLRRFLIYILVKYIGSENINCICNVSIKPLHVTNKTFNFSLDYFKTLSRPKERDTLNFLRMVKPSLTGLPGQGATSEPLTHLNVLTGRLHSTALILEKNKYFLLHRWVSSWFS